MYGQTYGVEESFKYSHYTHNTFLKRVPVRHVSSVQTVTSQSRSYFTTDGQSVSMSWCEPTLRLLTRCYFLSEGFCLKVDALPLQGALSDEMVGLQFAVPSLNDSSRKEPVTIFYCLIWGSRNLEGQVPLFISPGRGWPNYILRHWDHFMSPLTTRRAKVEVL
jgi:hypothetical protein